VGAWGVAGLHCYKYHRGDCGFCVSRKTIRQRWAGGKEVNLPEVAGDRLLVSHADFEQSCKVLLAEEQEKILPNNAIVSVLCDAVRLSREHCHYATKLGWDANKDLTAALRECVEALETCHKAGPVHQWLFRQNLVEQALTNARKLLERKT
jgi:hypothetical protein